MGDTFVQLFCCGASGVIGSSRPVRWDRGNIGIQFASKFGYRVAAIGRSSENAMLAKKLGANVYIDSKATNAAAELQ